MEPSTLLVLRKVRLGHEAAFEAWLRGVIEVSSKFPGHLGATVIRPGPGRPEYVLLVRWSTADDLRGWRSSESCREWLERVAPLTESVDARELHGLEAWFDLPGRPPPARWKMALLTLVAIYPLVLLFNVALGPALQELALPLRVALMSGMLVPTMTWVVMPALTRSFARWL